MCALTVFLISLVFCAPSPVGIKLVLFVIPVTGALIFSILKDSFFNPLSIFRAKYSM